MPIFAPILPRYGGQIQGSQGAIVMAGIPAATTIPLSEGDTGTAETIAYIRQLVDQGMKDPIVNRQAIQIVRERGVPSFDFTGEHRAVFDWARRNIRFTRDISGKETLRSAREILTVRAGDCDDINAILIPSLLGTMGHRLRLVTISAHPAAPETFSHIYAEVYSGGRWIPLDAARRSPAFGKGPERYYRKRVWSLTSGDYSDVKGLGYYAPTRPGMGEWDWGSFAEALKTGGQTATSIISALRTPSYALPPPPMPLPRSSVSPEQFQASQRQQQMLSDIPSWALWAGGGLVLLMLLKK